jgi:hypothetical protein
MLQMIDQFPKEEDWAKGRLDKLREETCRLVLSKRPKEAAEKKNRLVITQAQYKSLERKYRCLQSRYRRLRHDYDALVKQLRRRKIPRLMAS